MDEWTICQPDEGKARSLAAELALTEATALVLVARGLGEPAAARRFLEPRLAELRSPAGMADFDRAVERLAQAVLVRETIGIFGDYDVDGITTAALLATFLRACGAIVHTRVASRDAGYGFAPADAEAFVARGCRLIVTGDCGTSDHETIELAQRGGANVIVVDHHQVPEAKNPAFALINPHQAHCQFPFKGLASVGVAFYLAAALRTRLRKNWAEAEPLPDPKLWLDLVAVGTVADLMPLTEENRILVSAGLRVLTERRRPGLAALCERASVPAMPTAFDIGFRIAPRINAPGRMGDAAPALDLLVAPEAGDARALAETLEAANVRRRQIQEEVCKEAIEQVERAEREGAGAGAALLVASPAWHPGVLGIVAAKLVERFGRPAAVLGGDGPLLRGSIRSVRGFDATAALARCSACLDRFGGHQAAAGLSVAVERLEDFRRAWAQASSDIFAADKALGRGLGGLAVDVEVPLEAIDERVADELRQLGPFGVGNPEPVLVSCATAERTRVVGENHLQLVLRGGQARHDAIAFRLAERDPGRGAGVRVAFVPEIDEYGGRRRLRLRVRDWKPNAAFPRAPS